MIWARIRERRERGGEIDGESKREIKYIQYMVTLLIVKSYVDELAQKH